MTLAPPRPNPTDDEALFDVLDEDTTNWDRFYHRGKVLGLAIAVLLVAGLTTAGVRSSERSRS